MSGINICRNNSRQTRLTTKSRKEISKMLEIMYSPKDVGKEVMNSHGRTTKIRKYHMTDKEQEIARDKWSKTIEFVDKKIVKKAGKHFFNPFRKGIYYYQIQAMFLLGANEYHSLNDIVKKMEYFMSGIEAKKDGSFVSAWDKFRGKSSRIDAIRCKDFIGRIQENMVFFQRLNKLNPSGYKLRQVFSAVDIKRTNREGFPNGCYYYRLSTYDCVDLALPIRDYSEFTLPQHERKYISYKFIGTVITKSKKVIEGKIDEMSSV